MTYQEWVAQREKREARFFLGLGIAMSVAFIVLLALGLS